MLFHIKLCYAGLKSILSSPLLSTTVFFFFFFLGISFLYASHHISHKHSDVHIQRFFKFHLIWMYCNPGHYKHDASLTRAKLFNILKD